jgi:hypothetical protein
VEPRFTNLIRSWRPFVTRNVRKPKLCVLSESYTATDGLPPILPACRQPLLPACVFVTPDTVRHPRLFFGKFVHKPICSWWEAFVNRGSTVIQFTPLQLKRWHNSQRCCYSESTGTQDEHTNNIQQTITHWTDIIRNQIYTREAMYVQRNIVARSRNHRCSWNATMHSCVIELVHVTVNWTKILANVAQELVDGKFMSPATIRRTQVVM